MALQRSAVRDRLPPPIKKAGFSRSFFVRYCGRETLTERFVRRAKIRETERGPFMGIYRPLTSTNKKGRFFPVFFLWGIVDEKRCTNPFPFFPVISFYQSLRRLCPRQSCDYRTTRPLNRHHEEADIPPTWWSWDGKVMFPEIATAFYASQWRGNIKDSAITQKRIVSLFSTRWKMVFVNKIVFFW